jgi:hypothetical protein
MTGGNNHRFTSEKQEGTDKGKGEANINISRLHIIMANSHPMFDHPTSVVQGIPLEQGLRERKGGRECGSTRETRGNISGPPHPTRPIPPPSPHPKCKTSNVYGGGWVYCCVSRVQRCQGYVWGIGGGGVRVREVCGVSGVCMYLAHAHTPHTHRIHRTHPPHSQTAHTHHTHTHTLTAYTYRTHPTPYHSHHTPHTPHYTTPHHTTTHHNITTSRAHACMLTT